MYPMFIPIFLPAPAAPVTAASSAAAVAEAASVKAAAVTAGLAALGILVAVGGIVLVDEAMKRHTPEKRGLFQEISAIWNVIGTVRAEAKAKK
jgi:hypothetical protein